MTLDVHELYYLLSEIKVKNIMTPSPMTIRDTDTVVKCAAIMHDKNIGPARAERQERAGRHHDPKRGLPGAAEHHRRVSWRGAQIGFTLPDERGSLKEVLDCLRQHKARVISVLTSYDQVESGFRKVFIRIMDMDKSALNELRQELGEKYALEFWVRDAINPIS